jgi:hypothetical protein
VDGVVGIAFLFSPYVWFWAMGDAICSPRSHFPGGHKGTWIFVLGLALAGQDIIASHLVIPIPVALAGVVLYAHFVVCKRRNAIGRSWK